MKKEKKRKTKKKEKRKNKKPKENKKESTETAEKRNPVKARQNIPEGSENRNIVHGNQLTFFCQYWEPSKEVAVFFLCCFVPGFSFSCSFYLFLFCFMLFC